MNKWVVFFFTSIFSLSAAAQVTNRYVVFLKDKLNSPYSITQPQEFLSTKSIQRNGRVITEEDLPVTPSYISQLENGGALIIGTSKWFNAAVIAIDESNLSNIDALPFVSKIEYVAPGTKPVGGGRISDEEEQEDNETSNEVLIQHNMLNADAMHSDGYFGEGMLIAVIDGGFINVDQISYFSHLYDNQQVLDIRNFVTDGSDIYDHSDHGTRVLSTMAALGADYEGISTKADYLLYVTEASGEFRIEEYNWLMAAERADSIGVDIITTSVGYTDFDDASMDYTHDDLDGNTSVVTIAAEEAFERGIMVIASAGNSGNKSWEKVTPPADGEHVLAIGSVDNAEIKSNFSSVGPINANWVKPDLMAMGEKTVLIGQSGILATGNGTSFAAPQVASLVAGVWGKYPELTNIELTDILRKSADRGGNPDDDYGHGIPSYLAFENYHTTTSTFHLLENNISVFPNPVVDGTMQIRLLDPNVEYELDLEIYTTDGKKIMEKSTTVTWANNPIQVKIHALSKGIYIMKIKTPQQTLIRRIMKQ
jgi:subtilisin family serine protease